MMGSGDKVLLLTGETFFETSEEAATAHCEAEVERLQEAVDQLTKEEEDILQQQAALKQILYGRFGKSINLEA
jgi:chaperonin cofactor prefoldin